MTYSIVARDAATGQMGVAVQSGHLAVGAIVPWGEAGVGVVATQSFANADFGPEGLALLRSGVPSNEALSRLLGGDPGRESRQVALLDANACAAAHTGSACIGAAGHLARDGVSVQANMMTDETVWPAMLDAYERAEGDLAARLIAALQAAEEAGGDIRGRQSAALIIVEGTRASKPWQGRVFDLRVDDDPDPVTELARLVRLTRAHRAFGRFTRAAGAGKMAEAVPALNEAIGLAPEVDEYKLSAAIGVALRGGHDQAKALFAEIFSRRPGLVEWYARMAAAKLVPSDPMLLGLMKHAREGNERVVSLAWSCVSAAANANCGDGRRTISDLEQGT
jgi:uncharacterized Ntn-hydrolase superfamily protein